MPRTPCATFRKERSRNGESLSVLKSGLQKYVRRGEGEKALWCAGELLSFRDAPAAENPQRVLTNFRRRLMVTFLEDVGQPLLWGSVDALVEDWARARAAAARDKEEEAVQRLTELLALSPKSRSCSHARAVASAEGEAAALAREERHGDVAAVLAGLAAGRGPAEWEAALAAALEARDPQAILWAWRLHEKGGATKTKWGTKPAWAIFRALAGSGAVPPGLVALGVKWYKSDLAGLPEGYLCWMLPLLQAISDPGRALPALPAPPPGRRGGLADRGPMEHEGYVHDIHVKGPRRGGETRFALEGAFVENEALLAPRAWKAFYEDRKRLADGSLVITAALPPAGALPAAGANDAYAGGPETAYELLARAQINTSQAKTDVYYALRPADQRVVVVKGPFLEEKGVDRALAFGEWKAAAGLPRARAVKVRLIPDRWPAGVPLGQRNRVADRARPAWFLVSESLVDSPPPVALHAATKKWPATPVADWAHPALAGHVWKPMEQRGAAAGEKLDYVLALLARYVWGIPDQADRNFFRARGRVYSLDEDARAEAPDPSLRPALKKNKANLVLGWVREQEAAIIERLAGWPDAGPLVGRPGGPAPGAAERQAGLARGAFAIQRLFAE